MNTSETQNQTTQEETEEVLFETGPALKPTLILLSLVIITSTVIMGAIAVSPVYLLYEPQINQLVMAVVGILGFIISVKIIIRLIVLHRTSYIIRADSLERKTDMLFRYKSRKAPVAELRGFEYTQNPIQLLLGYGSIRLLTGGTNESLGFLVFENLHNAGKAKDYLERLI